MHRAVKSSPKAINLRGLLRSDKDPIKNFREESLANNLLTKDQITEIDVRVNKSVEDAVDFAEGSEEAPLKSLHDNVYA